MVHNLRKKWKYLALTVFRARVVLSTFLQVFHFFKLTFKKKKTTTFRSQCDFFFLLQYHRWPLKKKNLRSSRAWGGTLSRHYNTSVLLCQSPSLITAPSETLHALQIYGYVRHNPS